MRLCKCACGEPIPALPGRGNSTRRYLQGHHPGFGAEYQSARRVRLGETLKPHKPGAETIDSRDWFAQEEVSA